MTEKQKNQITEMRRSGMAYSSIAECTGISQNTVKSYCIRNHITSAKPTAITADITACEYCGTDVVQDSGRKHKRFCCDKCRNSWWKEHPDLINRKAVYDHTCLHCGRNFKAYGNAHRKYCSHSCYINARFGGESDE